MTMGSALFISATNPKDVNAMKTIKLRQYNARTDLPVITEAFRLLEKAGFETEMGVSVAGGYVGESMLDTNFGVTFVLYPEEFSARVIRVTVNYITAEHIIRMLRA